MNKNFKELLRLIIKDKIFDLIVPIGLIVVFWFLPRRIESYFLQFLLIIPLLIRFLRSYKQKMEISRSYFYLLPITISELIITEFVWESLNMILFFPIGFVFFSIFRFSNVEACLLSAIATLVCIGSSLNGKLNFKFNNKTNWQTVLVAVRSSGQILTCIFFCVGIFAIFKDKLTNGLISVLFIVILIYIFQFFTFTEQKFFNEHKAYAKLKFKIISDAFFIFVVVAYALSMMYAFSGSTRTPASVPTIQAKPSTQFEK